MIAPLMILLLTGALSSPMSTQTSCWGGSPYLQRSDSPFTGPAAYVLLENFEDGMLNIPGVTASTGRVVGPGPMTDSVDGDDGHVDGFGNNGFSYRIESGNQGVTFTFDAAVLGSLPTAVGLVWTDGAPGSTIFFEAFDAKGELIAGCGSSPVGDSNSLGGTAEDRFMGVSTMVAISSIRIVAQSQLGFDEPMEIDHLQLGAVTPWLQLGYGLAGQYNVPCLWGTGSLEPNTPAKLTVSSAPSQALGTLVVGAECLKIPFIGGVLVPSPDALLALVSDLGGNWQSTFRWPAGISSPIYLQAWFLDPGSPTGSAASNGLQAGLPWAVDPLGGR